MSVYFDGVQLGNPLDKDLVTIIFGAKVKTVNLIGVR